jgi:hypothetical protein
MDAVLILMPRRIVCFGSLWRALWFLHFFERLLHAETSMGKAELSELFLFFHKVHEFAPPPVMQFLSEGSPNLAAAERTGYCPAGSSGIFMDAVKRLPGCHRANAEFRCFMSVRLTTALLYSQQFIFFMQSPQILFAWSTSRFEYLWPETHHKY